MIIMMVVLILLISSCNNAQIEESKLKETKKDNIVEEEKYTMNQDNLYCSDYKIEKEEFIGGENIRVYYPKITGLSDKRKQQKINTIIKMDALDIYYSDAKELLNLEINYNIALINPNLLSIEVFGWGELKDSIHPSSSFYSTNIDIKNAKRVELKDMININEAFWEKIKRMSFEKLNGEEKECYVEVLGDLFSREDNLINKVIYEDYNYDDYSWHFSYFTKDSLSIIFSISHSLGDNFPVDIKYVDIIDNINIKNRMWDGVLDLDKLNEEKSKQVKKNIKDENIEIFENQCFMTSFKNWGKVKFVTARDLDKNTLKFYLIDDEGKILYELMNFNNGFYFSDESRYELLEVLAVAFRDLNNDGLKDILVVTKSLDEYKSEIYSSNVYFQRDDEFIYIDRLNAEIQKDGQNENINMLINFVKENIYKYDSCFY